MGDSVRYKKNLQVNIPWAPSVNSYWRSIVMKGRVRVLISAKGKAYRKMIATMALQWTRFGDARLKVQAVAYPPDRRRRDLDNLTKAVFDSLEHAGIFEDDEQIDFFSFERGQVQKPGWIELRIEELDTPVHSQPLLEF